MVAVKMFWDMWRNLTSSKSNWSFSGGRSSSASTKSKAGKPARYNRLSSHYGAGPSKSQSHPVGLISLGNADMPTSDSLNSGTAKKDQVSENNTTSDTMKVPDSKLCGWRTTFRSISSTFPSSSETQTPSQNIPSHLPEVDQTLNNNEECMGWSSANGGSHLDNSNNLAEEEDDDEDEQLTCDVCERAFSTFRKLADHQRRKRHFGCLQCDTIFPNRETLECHREQMGHYDNVTHFGYCCDDEDLSNSDSFETDDDENGLGDYSEECDDEERERLL